MKLPAIPAPTMARTRPQPAVCVTRGKRFGSVVPLRCSSATLGLQRIPGRPTPVECGRGRAQTGGSIAWLSRST